MKKIIIIPDSFKGTLSSMEICRIVKASVLRHYPLAEVLEVPVADGGEGTVDAFLTAAGGEKIICPASDPYRLPIDAFYGILPDNTAVIEMAACAGLTLVEGRENPAVTTTYGVGELMKDAISRGCRQLILGLGGSATNDMGMGAAAAMGVKFYDRQGNFFIPTGTTLEKIHSIDTSECEKRLSGVKVTVMCDINNPLYGPNGAAYVFSPQKGADEKMTEMLDCQLRIAAKKIHELLGIAVDDIPGAAAAGGMGAGMLVFFHAGLRMGIDLLLDTIAFDDLLQDTSLVITGEGKVDEQTLSGKVVLGVASRAKRRDVPVLVIAGSIAIEEEVIFKQGVTAMFDINRRAEDFSVSRHKSKENLQATIDSIMRFSRIF